MLLASTANAAEAMLIDDPITDNYKASYNADPTRPELRTWLSLRTITADRATWRPVAPDRISVTSDGSIAVISNDGRAGVLTARVTSGPLAAPIMRSDPYSASSGGRWGILATVTDRAQLSRTPAVVWLTLTIGGSSIGAGTVSYRYDSAFANAPAGNIEHNGPGGRWYVGDMPTRTAEEQAPATPPSIPVGGTGALPGPPLRPAARPRITRVQLPLRTTRPVVRMRVSGRNAGGVRITQLRVRIDARRWGRWIRTRSRYTLVLGRGVRTHAVRIQLRDARGRTSLVSKRRVRCGC
jgi:hypothetical protein